MLRHRKALDGATSLPKKYHNRSIDQGPSYENDNSNKLLVEQYLVDYLQWQQYLDINCKTSSSGKNMLHKDRIIEQASLQAIACNNISKLNHSVLTKTAFLWICKFDHSPPEFHKQGSWSI